MGKHKYVTIKRMEELWEEYKQWVKDNPIMVQDFTGKDATEVWRHKQRPLTKQRFIVWGKDKYNLTLNHYFDNPDNAYDDYRGIITHIDAERAADQIEGGMVGIYHPNITARLNGLTDSQKTEQSGTLTIVYKDFHADKPK